MSKTAYYLKTTSAFKKNTVVEVTDSQFTRLSSKGLVREATKEEIKQAESGVGKVDHMGVSEKETEVAPKKVGKTTKEQEV